MLSILIPTYNYDCYDLVAAMHRQASDLAIDFEIIVADDCSTLNMPRMKEIEKLSCTMLYRLEQNVGRSRIRNILIDKAKYDYLLFLDSDSLPANDDFLKRYVAMMSEGLIVLGGRVYNKPSDAQHTLLPKYGTLERNINNPTKPSIRPFTTPNFIIPKRVFSDVRFNENLSSYGHEDTIFGLDLVRNNYTYYRIDNPVIHVGIEDNILFLKKTREAIDHLAKLYTQGNYPELHTMSPLLKMYSKIMCFRAFFLFLYDKFYSQMEKSLNTQAPSLYLFSFYKLCYFCKSVDKLG